MKSGSLTAGPEHLPAPGVTSPAIEAVVQTTATETVYRRAGRGAPVLLLTAGAREPFGELLFRTLATRFRVIAPDFEVPPCRTGSARGPEEPVAVSAWLRDVIDGLGLEQPSIVADEALGIAALGFALLDPQRVDRLVVIRCDHPDPADPRGACDDLLGANGRPFLLLQVEAGPAEEMLLPSTGEAMIRFLEGAHGAAKQVRVR